MPINFHQARYFIRHYLTATRKGHNVHSPFVFGLCEEVFYNTAGFYQFKDLEETRGGLLMDNTVLPVEDFGAGSKVLKSDSRKVSDIARKGISTQKQSEMLYKLLNFLKPETIVEVGTSIGLNTLYLSLANRNSGVYSIEGSKALHAFASQLIARYDVPNCKLIHAKFDDALPTLLGSLDKLGLLYVDGNHTYEATLRYFNMALEKATNDTVLIFDDIYWSKGMTRAWEEIRKNSKVTLSIDAFYFGFIFFKKEIREQVHLRIFL